MGNIAHNVHHIHAKTVKISHSHSKLVAVAKVNVTKSPSTKKWRSLGKMRITHYCAGCNSPRGTYRSALGVRLKKGHVAMNGVKFGTKIKIGKTVYTVVDRVGRKNTVDIFIPANRCKCSHLSKKTVYKLT